MRSFTRLGARPPPESLLPKHIWSLTGGSYAQTKHWKYNYVVAVTTMAVLSGVAFYLGKDKEIRTRAPERWLPSMLYDKELKEAYLNNPRRLDKDL